MTTTVFEALVGDLFADVARRVLADRSVRKSASDRQFLKDLGRSQYGWKAPTRLAQLCERSTDPVTQFALAEALRVHAREHCGSSVTLGDEPALELQETRVQGETDLLQLLKRNDPDNDVIKRQLRDSLLREEEAARRYRECVELELPT